MICFKSTIVLLFCAFDYTTSQNCGLRNDCEPLMKEIPNCDGLSIAIDCLKHLNRDCHFSQRASDALTTEEFITDIICENSDLYSKFKLKSDCWGNLEFRKDCITPLALSNQEFTEYPKYSTKQTKIQELRTGVETCKIANKDVNQECNILQENLLDLSTKIVIATANASIQTHLPSLTTQVIFLTVLTILHLPRFKV